ncbi:hypothetical protein J1N35_040481 [Gossypium stocksii]|uniref:Uncharacterized protein n=1 Tax=Gossypium stocksii TaxID=47602 RepID=A0A9D3UEA0_9ROSI|nr:hypothetical protein J1N35_040481 [Gossypium stocksii]
MIEGRGKKERRWKEAITTNQSQCSKVSIEMTKGRDEQNVPMETCGKTRKNSRSRDMLLALEGQVTNLEESISGVKETLVVVKGCTDELNSMREKLEDYVMETLNSNRYAMQETINVTVDN